MGFFHQEEHGHTLTVQLVADPTYVHSLSLTEFCHTLYHIKYSAQICVDIACNHILKFQRLFDIFILYYYISEINNVLDILPQQRFLPLWIYPGYYPLLCRTRVVSW